MRDTQWDVDAARGAVGCGHAVGCGRGSRGCGLWARSGLWARLEGLWAVGTQWAVGAAGGAVGCVLACGVPVLMNAGIGDVDAILDGRRVGVTVTDFTAEAYDAALDAP